ncbi:general substrate transporter [Aspergillus pseudotamarii]|uniref:General substrate transporter n=1 Tax=Aspergillus pseudotamarii TaxID=132259 RepID=A0A5N6SYN7_ASPPS|nr:general substrate transporter [Aspergillus pseudotamarii]KAE8138891.1 general substrate transporter [Aspergillus pseudotamarii]
MGKQQSSLGKYLHAIKDSPREVFNRRLFLTVIAFALGGCAKGWDEGSAAAITQLPSFQDVYHLNDNVISNVVSLVNLGAGIGALLSFLLNDRIGRIRSLQVYQVIYIVGYLISCFSTAIVGVLYIGRIIAGLGIGALSVVCPMAISEIAPKAVRGLMALWFNICMLSGQTLGVFIVYGCSIHISPFKDLQYQVPWFAQTFVSGISIALSFFIVESPRWLLIDQKHNQSLGALARLRGLPNDAKFVATEFHAMASQIEDREAGLGKNKSIQIIRDTFLIKSNLRRVQLTIIVYILAQMSGANAITNYLPTIFGLIGITDSHVKVYSTGLYTVAKLICCVAASLFLIDLLGRRKSLILGISFQIICHSYLAGYLKIYQTHKHSMSKSSTDAALAFVYIHAFGWAIGLYSLPYLFGAELWPNKIRSFGGALSQCFHWLFYFAITKATPFILTGLHQWGAFVLFIGFCVLALLYTYFIIPETAGMSLEEINKIFERPLLLLARPLQSSEHVEQGGSTGNELGDLKANEKWIEKA